MTQTGYIELTDVFSNKYSMTSLYKIVLFFPILIIIGCSGSGSSPVGSTDIPLETCFDVEVTNAGDRETQNICTTLENGGYNGLGVARFIKFNVSSTAAVSVRVTRTSGVNPADPDIVLYQNGAVVNYAESTSDNTEYMTTNLGAGDYVLEINEYAYFNSSAKQKVNTALTQKTTDTVVAQATSPSTCTSANNSTVTGIVTFDRVPHVGGGLAYSFTTEEPIQQAVVEVICNGGAYSTGVTGVDGSYSLTYPDNMSSFVRVNAQMLKAGENFTVVDNTISGQPLYVMDDNAPARLLTSGNANRTFNADSGWGGTSYTNTRVAAPFAILDSIRKAKEKVLTAAPGLSFPALKINWSPANSSLTIGTSYYNSNITQIFLLGAENSDTDEYDEHVIIHEWGHYFEDKFSRADSIGGSHSGGDILDMRVAFGEGFGNAFSSIVTDNALYRDSSGSQQSAGFIINMEDNGCTNAGWYSECSVQSTLYDIYDVSNDGADTLNLDFKTIYDVLVDAQRNTPALTSIFSFTTYFKDQNAASANAVDSILSTQNIDPIMDVYGSSQITANPGNTDQLPVYGSF